jgi:hypothetical protein
VQLVVADDRLGALFPQQGQHAWGIGPPVDRIAQRDQAMRARAISGCLQQLGQLSRAPLDVTHEQDGPGIVGRRGGDDGLLPFAGQESHSRMMRWARTK